MTRLGLDAWSTLNSRGKPLLEIKFGGARCLSSAVRTVTVLLAIWGMRAEMTVSSAGTSPRNSSVPYRQASPPHAPSRSCGAATGGRSYLKTPHEEIIDEIYAVCDRDCRSPAGRRRSDCTSRRVCGRRRSRRLCRSQWSRRCRTTRGSGCRNEWNEHEIGPSSWHERHGCARQHRDQSSGARLCFRKWPAGLPLTL